MRHGDTYAFDVTMNDAHIVHVSQAGCYFLDLSGCERLSVLASRWAGE